ncbi:MAG: BspA family leucine-rich repeat surface protein [Prevotella sp.]|nr:BspA family leucine-rich repeat surface protein [Prevotella sp.]
MKTSYRLLLLAVLLMTFCMASARKTYIGPNAVDLGLSVLWGDKNMQDVSLNTLYFYWAQTSNGGNGMTLVGTDEEYPDNICGTQYDVATEYYGDGWRMPTADEFRELYEKCSSRFASDGVTFTAANGNSITLGLVGYIKNGTNTNDYSYYWTGTKGNPGIWSPYIVYNSHDPNVPNRTYQKYAPDAFGFNSSGLKDKDKICNYLYSNGYQCAIRPVKDKVGSDATAYAILDNGTLSFYYDSSKKLRSGKAYDIAASYTSSNLPGWAADSLSIKKVVFNTSFAKFSPTSTAFWFGGYYNNLATITGLNFLNTANVTNMNNMFSKCKSLRTLDLSTFVTSKVTNMSAMFYNCSALESLNLQNFDTTNVIDMSFMFANCSSLQSLEVSFFNTAKVTSMSSMFTNCSKLKSLELRNFNTSNVTKMGWMFYGCNSLTDLYVSTFDTSKVTDVNCMFYDCENLTTIDVSGFNTSNATNMSFMFRGCSRLEKLYMGGFYTSNVTNMMCMFYGCTSLTTIYVKENWNTDKVTNSANMFGSCNSLVGGAGTKFSMSHIDKGYARIDGTNTPGYFTNMAPALASGTKAYAVYNNNVLTFYYDNKSSSRTGTKYEVKASYTSKNKPGWVNDYYRRIFTKAVFDSSFASYQPTSTAFWFYDCSLMKSIEGITNLKTSKVTSMAEMFRYCNLLNNLDLRTFDTSNVTDMSCMFCYCHSLTNLKVSSFNTSKVTDMSHLFHQCPLSSIDVSNFDTKNVTNMLLMFADCTQLKTLDLKNFNTAKVSDMGYMFCSCYALTTIYAGNLWSTANLRNGYRMFTDDYRLVGSMGTVYDPAHTNQAYAHIDGGRCNPGYLYGDITPADLGPKEAYAALDGGVLTFYYDNFKDCTDGKIYPIESAYSYSHLPAWHEDRSQIMAGAFDSSFADYRPTNTSYWFYELEQMTSLNDVVNLNTSEVSWMSSMFWECNSLRTLDVSNFNTAKVRTMHGMFTNCHQLSPLGVSHFNTANVEDMSSMFWGCNSLTKLDVSKFNTANVKNMYGMFYDCKNLKAIDVSKFNTANVENMAAMFMRCEVLENLNLKNFNTAKVTNMEMMFYMCYKLQSLDVSSFNTSNVTSMRSMFDWLKSVKKLDLRSFNTSKVTNMQSMFSGCSILEEVYVSSFDTRNVTDMTGMFHDLGKMKTVDISNFNTANVELMEQMFYDSPELTTIYAGDGWTTASVKNSQDMFTASKKLVGGAGTKYSSSHTDHAYARIDGGTSRPGYFTKKVSCDVNGDGNVDVADIATIIDVMAGKGDAATEKAADVNGDGNVDVADIATVITEMAARARLQQTVIEEE